MAMTSSGGGSGGAMLTDINDKYLAQLGSDSRYANPVTCGSCHLGQTSPPAFEGKWR